LYTIKSVGSVNAILPDTEEQIVQHVLKSAQSLFGVTPNIVRTLSFSVVERSQASHEFKRKTKMRVETDRLDLPEDARGSLSDSQKQSLASAADFSNGRAMEFLDARVKTAE
jgi:hypothetical protein